jgi:hypothetical protein
VGDRRAAGEEHEDGEQAADADKPGGGHGASERSGSTQAVALAPSCAEVGDLRGLRCSEGLIWLRRGADLL